ncbi:glucose-6-phosphatase catalytic subunit 1-like [Oratosquilla oratoria]|uniref:glucose-6-phosphatase catalytic subunit 1-like n=1 Tax=Oratosquilla oratoria TaxID=337810 RepID=UPI003F76D83E
MEGGELSLGDQWNLRSVETIVWLQSKLSPYEEWITQVSVWGDNRQAFIFFFPLIAGFCNELGARTLWATIFVEWSNLLLKWLFNGDRPYWWIGETSLYTDETRPKLKQFPNTCESGPGTPSGHIMMNVAIFYVIAKGFSRYIWKSNTGTCKKILGSLVIYIAYVLWIALVFVSRLYIQAHFIHQNVLALFFGIAIGNFCFKTHFLTKVGRISMVIMAVFLITSSVGMYSLLLSWGLDPLWTIPLALKHCYRTQYVSVETQAFYLMMRFTGATLGLGLGITSEQRKAVVEARGHMVRTILGAKGGVLIGRIASMIQSSLPTDDLVLYLALSFGLNIMMVFTVIALLPHFLLSVYRPI